MAKNEKFGIRDPKYCEWHRSLPHNHLMLDFDMLDLMERTLFGIFSGLDSDGDDDIKCLFECKEIQLRDKYYFLPHIDSNQAKCLRSFCKRYDKNGVRKDIPFFIVSYSIDKENSKRWFVVTAMNDVCYEKLKQFSKKEQKQIVMSEQRYIYFLSFLIGKHIYKSGSSWLPEKNLVV